MAYDGEVIIKIDGDGMLSGLQGALERLGSYLGDVGEQIHDGLATPMKDAAKAADDSMAKIMKSLSGGMSTLLQVVGAVEKAGKGFETASAAVSAFTTAHTAAAGAEAAAAASLTIYQAAVGVLTGQLGFAAAAQGVLNAAMAASPVGVIAVAVAALMGGLALLGAATRDTTNEFEEFDLKSQELRSELEKQREVNDRLAEARKENLSTGEAEIQMVQGYVSELKGYLDENGKVEEAHESRAEYLANEINNLIPGVVEALGDEEGARFKIKDSIDEEILAKQRSMALDALREEQMEAIENQDQKERELTAALLQKGEAQQHVSDLQQRAIDLTEAAHRAQDSLNQSAIVYDENGKAMSLTIGEIIELQQENADKTAEWQQRLQDSSTDVQSIQEELDGYANILERVKDISAAQTQEDFRTAVSGLSQTIVQATGDNREALEQAVADAQVNYDRMVADAAESWDTMSDDQRNASINQLRTLKNALDEQVQAAIEGGCDIAKATGEGAARGAYAFPEAIQKIIDDSKAKLDAAGAAVIGSGENFGAGFEKGVANSIDTILKTVESSGEQSLDTLNTTLDENSPSEKTRASGRYFSQGLELGILEGKSGVIEAAKRVAQEAVKAAKATLEIQSPSRVMRDKVGKMLSAGMALGIADGEGGVRDAVRRVSDVAFAAARDGGGSYREIGARYMEDLSYGVKAGRDAAADEMARFVKADVEAYKKKADDETAVLVKAKKEQMDKVSKAQKDALQKETDQLQKDASDRKKAYEDAANGAAAAYKAKLAEGFDDALDITRQKVTAITDAFQKAHDAVSRQQESMQSKLAGYGDMFTAGKSGDLTLGNIEKNIEAIKRYDQALTALAEKGVSDEFMAKVTALGVDEGTKFAEKLVHMGTDGFSKYMDAWDEQQRLSQEVSSRFYAGQLEALDSGFQSKLGEALAGVPGTMANLGAESLQSWADGLSAQMGDSAQDVKGLLDVLVATFGKAGNAPQATDGGQGVVAAFADGITQQAPAAVSAAQAFVKSVLDVLGGLSGGMDAGGAQEDGAQTTDAYAGGIAARLGQVAKAAQGTVDAFSGTVAERQGAVRSSAGQTAQSFCDTVNARYGQFRQTGLYAMQGLETGLREGGQSAISTAAWIADSIISEMQRALDIHSPSRKMARLVGKPAAEGVAVGFDREMARVYRRIRGTLDGELSRISAAVQPQADREAARLNPQPIQTVYRSETVEKQPVVEFRGSLAALGRVLEPHIRVESRRRGGNLVKGEIR